MAALPPTANFLCSEEANSPSCTRGHTPLQTPSSCMPLLLHAPAYSYGPLPSLAGHSGLQPLLHSRAHTLANTRLLRAAAHIPLHTHCILLWPLALLCRPLRFTTQRKLTPPAFVGTHPYKHLLAACPCTLLQLTPANYPLQYAATRRHATQRKQNLLH